jgi:potassium efflux system protein
VLSLTAAVIRPYLIECKLTRTARRPRVLRTLARSAPVALLLILQVLPLAAAEKPQLNGGPAWSPLLTREPLGFNWQTIQHLAALLRDVPGETGVFFQFARHQRAMLGRGSVLVVLLALAVAYGIFGRAALARRFKASLAPLADRIRGGGKEYLAALTDLIAAALLPLLLWWLWRLVKDFTGFEGPLFIILGQLLLAWTLYAVATSLAHALLVRPLLRIRPEHGRRIFRLARLLIAYAIAVEICTNLMKHFGAPPDLTALTSTGLQLLLIVMLALVTVRRQAVVELFPQASNSLYRGFVAGFSRFYPFIWALTLGIALIQLAGFRALANFLWARTWLPAGIFLAAVLFDHLIQQALRRSFYSSPMPREGAIALHRSLSRLVRYATVLGAIAIFTRLLGGFHPLYGVLSQPVATLGDKTVSILVLIKAVLILVIFWLSARLVRDYCEFRIYPRHNIDPGAATAINTLIVYAIFAIGVLASVEAVGLGVGTITLFAGAMGIGIGMGLQSMANNLTSGFTLIFTRALRKGDVVTTGDTIGVIQEVGIRATRMKTFDAIEYLVPNSEFIDGKIVNWTRSDPYTRLHVPIGVSYEAAPEQVRQIMKQVAADTPNVQQVPPPEVRFVGMGDSSLNFELLLWINVKEIQPEQVRSDLYFALFRALKEAGIEIPFPQRDIHIRSADAAEFARVEPGNHPARRS